MQHLDESEESQRERFRARVSQMRLVTFALALAPLLFAGVVVGVVTSRGPALPNGAMLCNLLAGISLVLLVVGIVISVIQGRALAAQARRGEPVSLDRAAGAVIMAAAFVEAPALLAATAGLLGGVEYLAITCVCSAIMFVQCVRVPERLRDMTGMSPTWTWR